MKRIRVIVVYLVLLLFFTEMQAQVGLYNGGTLYLSGGSDVLFVGGDFTNSATAALTNNGQLHLKQNISNSQASMSAGTGTLYINGTAGQSLNGSQPFRTYNLITDNSNGITLNNDLSISASHTFTSGLLHSSATPNYLIYESGASYTGSSDSRHVTGWVKKNGNTGFVFPVGDNTYLRSIEMSNLTASGEFDSHYFTPTQNVLNLMFPIVGVKANEYWELNKISGGSAQITVNWDHLKVPMDNIVLSDIKVGYYTSGNWTDAGGTGIGSVTTTGYAVSNSISSFGEFTLGYAGFPVPLKLISFTGWRKTGVSYLHWVSENEQNVSHFSVERSFDGVSFTSVGTVAARNRSTRELYNFADPVSFTGNAFYRLKSVDIDAKYAYSTIVRVNEETSAAAITVMNPASSGITILNKSGVGGLYNYNLFTAAGQLIQRGMVNLPATGASFINIPYQISNGIYTLALEKSGNRITQQVLIER